MTYYVGYKLPKEEKRKLLELFPASYPITVAHHCTVEYGVNEDTELPSGSVFRVVGYVNDMQGIEALVLSVDGTTTRPNGLTYHITWSRTKDRSPVESNDVIRDHGYNKIVPITIHMEPKLMGTPDE